GHEASIRPRLHASRLFAEAPSDTPHSAGPRGSTGETRSSKPLVNQDLPHLQWAPMRPLMDIKKPSETAFPQFRGHLYVDPRGDAHGRRTAGSDRKSAGTAAELVWGAAGGALP